jgi:hypothetical protein
MFSVLISVSVSFLCVKTSKDADLNTSQKNVLFRFEEEQEVKNENLERSKQEFIETQETEKEKFENYQNQRTVEIDDLLKEKESQFVVDVSYVKVFFFLIQSVGLKQRV